MSVRRTLFPRGKCQPSAEPMHSHGACGSLLIARRCMSAFLLSADPFRYRWFDCLCRQKCVLVTGLPNLLKLCRRFSVISVGLVALSYDSFSHADAEAPRVQATTLVFGRKSICQIRPNCDCVTIVSGATRTRGLWPGWESTHRQCLVERLTAACPYS